jgi:hypothetical protein
MTVSIINDFASLGAALKQREKAKQPAKVADVPTEPVNNYPAPNWADIYGTTNAPSDYLGYTVVIPGELGPGGYSSITMTRAEFDARYLDAKRDVSPRYATLVLPSR